jgi:hypothetical protein
MVARILWPVLAASKAESRTRSRHPIIAFVLIESPWGIDGIIDGIDGSVHFLTALAQKVLDERKGGVLLGFFVIVSIKNKRVLQH